MLENRCIKIIIIFYISFFVLIISPSFNNIVHAALPITLCDWDDVASGLDNGTSGYFNWTNVGTVNYFETSSAFDYSPPNALKIYGSAGVNGMGWLNLTQDFSYIGLINFTVYEEYSNADSYMKFYDSEGNLVIDIMFDSGVIKWKNDVGYQELWPGYTTQRYFLIFKHIGNNQFNITVLSSTFSILKQVDLSNCYAETWYNFTSIYIYGSGSQPNSNHYDNFIIDTTYYGPSDEIPEGYLGVNCFDESTGYNITDFDIIFANWDNQVYYDYNLNNTYVIWGDLLPQGNCVVTVSKIDYYPRSYVIDVEEGYFVVNGVTYLNLTLNFYLPPINLSLWYTIQVVNEYNNPLSNVYIHITKPINFSGGTVIDVGSSYTDASGNTQWYLLALSQYWVHCSKTGYENVNLTWIPPYAENYTYVIKMTKTIEEQKTVFDNITWDIQPIQRDFYDNFTMFFNISSSDNQLEYFTMNVTFYNTSTLLWDYLYENTITTTSGGSMNYTTVNGVGKYKLVCSYKKNDYSEYFFMERIYHIWAIIPVSNVSETIDDILTKSLGPSPVYVGTTIIGYSSLIGAVVVTFLLFTFSPKYAGFGICIVGIMLGVLKSPFIGIIGSVISWTAVVIIIILGVLMTLAYKKDR